MPLYEYECESCGVRFEVIQKFADASVDTCRTCGGKVHRMMSAPAIQFKGTGWYITDYARKGKTDGGDTSTSAKAPSTNSDSSSSTSDKAPAAGASQGGGSATPSSPGTSSSTGGDKK
jgi:putative FmdB family regulatory protein